MNAAILVISALQSLAISSTICSVNRISAMSRSRAIAIAAEQKARQGQLVLAAGLLLLPAALLLLLISP